MSAEAATGLTVSMKRVCHSYGSKENPKQVLHDIDFHLTRHEVEIDVVQYLFRILLAAVTVTNPLHTYGQPGGCFCAHQKSSAGSSMITLRTARSPAAMHIELVRIKTTPTRKTVNRVTTPVVAVNIA